MKNVKIYLLYLVYLIILVVLIYFLRGFIKPILISLILAYILSPVKKHLENRGMPSQLASLLAVLIIIVFIIFILFILIPNIVKEIFVIASNFDYIEESLKKYTIPIDKIPAYLKGGAFSVISKAQNYIVNYLNKMFVDTLSVSKELPLYFLVPIFVYYFIQDEEYFKNQVMNIIPLRIRKTIIELAKEIDKVIGNYIKGQLILSIIITVLTFIVLVVFKIRFPLFIAIINGFANIIPYFGPILGFLPALLIALTESLSKAILVSIFFFVLQEVESSIIAPKVLGDSLGIHPIYIILILLVGGKFFGGIGLLLAIPIAGILKVTYNYFMNKIF
ncbi:MAG: AI-2E family transporter [Clostridiales bacterium]|nr:AI-2E family transporter [Clostridiales bacterium]